MLSLLLAVIMCFCACSRSNKVGRLDLAGLITADDLPENQGQTQILTHVYRETRSMLPDGLALAEGEILFDAKTGILACVVTDGDGNEPRYTEIKDGAILLESPLPLEENEWVRMTAVREEAVYYLSYRFDDDSGEDFYWMNVLKPMNGEHTKSEELSSRFAPDWNGVIQIKGMTADLDGDVILLSGGDEIGILGSDLRFKAVFDAPYVQQILTDPTGQVQAVRLYHGEYALCPVKKTALKLGDGTKIPASWQGIGAKDFIYSAAGDLMWMDDTGVRILRGDGAELVMNYQNSSCYAGEMGLRAAPEEELLLLTTEKNWRNRLSLWESAGDIDLSAVRVIEFANTVQMPEYVVTAITEFNRTHPEYRIAVKDYFTEGEDGASRLVFDITTGAYRPDVVLGKNAQTDFRYFRDHGMTLDLSALMDADSLVKADNIFGSVRKAFATEDGGMWAIPAAFRVRTLAAPGSVSEETGGGTGWDLEELLDYAESLPSDHALTEGLTRETAAEKLLGPNGYGIFFDIDSGRCDFDSPLFLRWLEYLLSLPANEAELMKTSSFDRADDGERARMYREGRVTLLTLNLNSLSSILAPVFRFGDRGWVWAGYPTEGNTPGAATECGTAFAIMSWAEDAEAIWKIIRSVVSEDRSGELNILKSRMEEDLSIADRYDTIWYLSRDRGYGARLKDPDNPLTETMLDDAGVILDFTPEDGKRFMDLLDAAGDAFAKVLPEEVLAIVEEEISVLFGSASTAESCAKKIQSRASIWLAEHR